LYQIHLPKVSETTTQMMSKFKSENLFSMLQAVNPIKKKFFSKSFETFESRQSRITCEVKTFSCLFEVFYMEI
jgi:hypothetical protein